MTLKSSTTARNAAADAVCALANSGKLRVYSGTRPANPQTAITSQTLLAELTLNSTAFGAAVAGVATANAVTSDTAADATGTATWFRVVKSDGSTVLWDGDVGTSGSDLNIATTSIVANAIIACTSLTYTQPE